MGKKTITQYYVEFVDRESGDYVLQSKWFDTQEEAIKWVYNSFDYIRDSSIDMDLMKAKWDDKEGVHQDIHFVKALNNDNKNRKRQETETIQKYLEFLGWGFETETPLTTYDELRDHLDKIERENPHLTYWDYPIEEVLDRIKENEIFFCISGRMFETHRFINKEA